MWNRHCLQQPRMRLLKRCWCLFNSQKGVTRLLCPQSRHPHRRLFCTSCSVFADNRRRYCLMKGTSRCRPTGRNCRRLDVVLWSGDDERRTGDGWTVVFAKRLNVFDLKGKSASVTTQATPRSTPPAIKLSVKKCLIWMENERYSFI